jgi:phosphoribosylformylglycinamidine synthase
MKYIAHINVMPLKELLDPQGKAVNNSLHNLGLSNVHDVRIGKHISLQIDALSKDEAESMAREACKKLLANPVMEAFDLTLTEG